MERQLEQALAQILGTVKSLEKRMKDIDSGMDYLMSVSEVADILGTTTNSIRNWAAEGRIKCVYLPGSSRAKYRRSDVLALIDSLDGGYGHGGDIQKRRVKECLT